MTQIQRLDYMIQFLLNESPEYQGIGIPENVEQKKSLLRALMNLRLPKPLSQEFLDIQDAYFQEEKSHSQIVSLQDLSPIEDHIYLWRGDITHLACGAIVNAANSQMLGCFIPNHRCIDNAIHTFAGIELRLEMKRIMDEQGHPEAVGQAKITPAYNLPCNYIIHTVGPYVAGALTLQEEEELKSCYESCLKLADQYDVGSIAFCCISTGEFHFPNQRAAEIAVTTVKNYLKETKSSLEVIFNVFKPEDERIYQQLLGRH